MELEELMSGGGTAQTPQHAQLAVVDVGNIRASVLARGLGIELEDVREKPGGELIINVLRRSHKFFSPQQNIKQGLIDPGGGFFGSAAGF
jgi:hypothetical protein